MNKGIFITGTDTGVGKTFVACGLIRAMKEMGMNVCPMKPLETGCRTSKGKLVPADASDLMKASGVREPIDVINPYRFRHPLAPSIAAAIEGVKINRKKLLAVYNRLSHRYDIIIVEGAGGIMVPVYRKYFFLDLAKDLDLPVVIVSRPGTGTINHTLLTIESLRNKGLDLPGVIINYASKTQTGLSEKTNPEMIERLGRVPVLGIVPYSVNRSVACNKKMFNQIVKKILHR